MMRPNFFIVGAPKCGSTALHEYLNPHLEIFMAPKEPHFFGSDLHWDREPRRRLNESEYLSCFMGAKDEQRVGEASVFYLYYKHAAIEIRGFCPAASIIIMLRNPVEMLYSRHSQNLFTLNEDLKDFGAALEAEADRELGLRIPRSVSVVDTLFYRKQVQYSEQVQRYFDAFNRENVHVIIYDDFRYDLARVYRETLRFLGVDQAFQPDSEVANPNKVPRSRVVQRMLQSRQSPVMKYGLPLISFCFRWAVKRALLPFITKNVLRPPMDPGLRLRLQAEFAPEVERLSVLLGRDLTHWSLSAESPLKPESEAPVWGS